MKRRVGGIMAGNVTEVGILRLGKEMSFFMGGGFYRIVPSPVEIGSCGRGCIPTPHHGESRVSGALLRAPISMRTRISR